MGVVLGDASAHGQTVLDRELYLSQVWEDDAERRQAGGVPEAVAFASAVPARWVTADEIYGNDYALRRWLEAEEST
ncbi:hypothetical protein BH23CHL1_BH23CHL1_08760 [soil metagenome]